MRILFKLLILSAAIFLVTGADLIKVREIEISGKNQSEPRSNWGLQLVKKQNAANSMFNSTLPGSQSKPSSFEWIGRSMRAKIIRVHFWGHGNTYVYILGAIHGNECQTTQLVEGIWKLLEQNFYQKYKTAITFILVPCLNPDGTLLHCRTNANGVDLNRNFPVPYLNAEAKGSRYYGAPSISCSRKSWRCCGCVRLIRRP